MNQNARMASELIGVHGRAVPLQVKGRGAWNEGHGAHVAAHDAWDRALGAVAHQDVNRSSIVVKCFGYAGGELMQLELDFRINGLEFNERRRDFDGTDACMRREADDAAAHGH